MRLKPSSTGERSLAVPAPLEVGEDVVGLPAQEGGGYGLDALLRGGLYVLLSVAAFVGHERGATLDGLRVLDEVLHDWESEYNAQIAFLRICFR